MSKSNQMSAPPKLSIHLLFLLAIFVFIQQEVDSSGIFELNLSALTDAYGRDLRLDCCAWHNASQEKQQQMLGVGSNLIQPAASSVSSGRYAAPAAAAAAESCDPTKCQLIIRICVKNYQTQIDPSQCTFGELSAQVMRPDETTGSGRHHNSNNNHAHHHQNNANANHMSSLARLQQQQQLAAFQKMKLANGMMMTQSNGNIHHQRMLLQQLQQAPYLTMGSTSSEQHARLFHQVPSQARSMRQIAFDQPISFPFNFTWPGAFSLVIDAWYESPTGLQQLSGSPFSATPNSYPGRLYQQPPSAHHHAHHGALHHHIGQPQPASQLAGVTSYDLYKKQLIIQHSMHGWLTVKNEWTSGMHKTDAAQLVYSYRVTCQPNYYGEQCNILCRPRDDVYGHFVCSDLGDVVCLPGWQGKYCEDPICTPGCHKDQGNCTRPNECNCRFGWQGPSCEQCVRYPGCVHGTCSKPHDCNCEEGWGGLLCNEDLRYCTNHQPCKNGATCKNRFDETGEGSYECLCEEGFTGKNCERRIQAQDSINTSNQALQNSTLGSQTNPLLSVAGSLNNPMAALVAPMPQSMAAASPNHHHVSRPVPGTATNKETNAALSGTGKLAGAKLAANVVSQPPMSFLSQPGGIAMQPSTMPSASLDHRVMVAYGIIIVCMVILVVLLLLRIFFERLSGAVVGCGQRLVSSGSNGTIWSSQMISSSVSTGSGQHESMERRRSSSSRRHNRHHNYHHRHLHHQSTRSLGLGVTTGSTEHDVATLQNHQNIYKSRSSLSTDKMAMMYGTNDETCSSSASSTVSSSASSEDLANHHAALQAQYSASAHYGTGHHHHNYGHHAIHAPPHHAHPPPPPHSLYGSVPATAAPAAPHHHLPLPPVHHTHDPYHAMVATHSVHNLSSATYQHLNQRLSQQPPPPPYTISGNMVVESSRRHSSQMASTGSAIYNSHSTTYAPAGSIYAGASYRYPASMILGPAAAPGSIYNTSEAATYGTAATLAAHCVSAGNYSLSRSGATSVGALPLPQDASPRKSKVNPNKSHESSTKASSGTERSHEQQQQQRDEATTTTSNQTTTNSPYGNLQRQQQQQTATTTATSHHANESTVSDEASQQRQQRVARPILFPVRSQVTRDDENGP